MADDSRFSELMSLFDNIEPEEKDLVSGIVRETAFLENRMQELKKLPFLSVHPKKKYLQKQTAAAKQYKECSQSYANNVRILLNVIRKVEPSAQDELLRRLEEFR